MAGARAFCQQEEEGAVSKLQQVAAEQRQGRRCRRVKNALHCYAVLAEDLQLPDNCQEAM